eukprot:IDg17969t1
MEAIGAHYISNRADNPRPNPFMQTPTTRPYAQAPLLRSVVVPRDYSHLPQGPASRWNFLHNPCPSDLLLGWAALRHRPRLKYLPRLRYIL